MKNTLNFLLILIVTGIPLTTNGAVVPDDWTGSVVVTGDTQSVPSDLASLNSLIVKTGAIVNHDCDLTINTFSVIGRDSTLSTYNMTGGSLTVGAGLEVGHSGYGASLSQALGEVNQTGGSVYANGTAAIIGSGPASVGTYNISGSGTSHEGFLTILGSSGSTGNLTIDNGATYRCKTKSSGWLPGCMLVGYNTGTGNLTVTSNASLILDAELNIGTDSTGTVNLNGGASLVSNTIKLGGAEGSGTLNLSGGTIKTKALTNDGEGSATFNFTGGTLSADRVSGITVVQDGGVVSPGNSPGKSAFEAGYTMQAAGTYLVEINGSEQGDVDANGYGYDWIDVTGTASLAGTIEIDVLENDLEGGVDITSFIPAAQTYFFDVLTAETIVIDEATFELLGLDDMASLDLAWTYEVLGAAGSGQTLRLAIESTSAVPEPSTLILLLGLVAGMQFLRRR